MFVSKATPKTYAISMLSILLILLAGFSFAGDKKEKHGYLGVMLQDINSSLAEAMDLESKDGVLVSSVIEDGPAEKAGLLDGDVIIKFQGQSLSDYKDLTKVVRSSSVGDEVEIVVLRDGKEETLNVELGEREEQQFIFYSDKGEVHSSHDNENYFSWESDNDHDIQVFVNGMDALNDDRGFMGVELDDISEQMGDYFDVEDGNGALITSVSEDSAAEKAGLKAGDIIVKMGDEDIESAADVHSAMSDTKADDDMVVEVVRKGKDKSLNITLAELPEDRMHKRLQMFQNGNTVVDIRTPKMLFHGMPHAPRTPHSPQNIHRNMRVIVDSEEDLEEMREELEQMKEDLLELRDELKKK